MKQYKITAILETFREDPTYPRNSDRWKWKVSDTSGEKAEDHDLKLALEKLRGQPL